MLQKIKIPLEMWSAVTKSFSWKRRSEFGFNISIHLFQYTVCQSPLVWIIPWCWLPGPIFCVLSQIWARFLSLARSKLRLCSANHRAGYFSNLACDWLSIVWAYSEQETENGPWWARLSVTCLLIGWTLLTWQDISWISHFKHPLNLPMLGMRYVISLVNVLHKVDNLNQFICNTTSNFNADKTCFKWMITADFLLWIDVYDFIDIKPFGAKGIQILYSLMATSI